MTESNEVMTTRVSIKNSGEAGIGLIEILAALVLISLVSIGVATSTIGALSVLKKTEVNYAASNLALSKIEELAAYDPSDLDVSFGGTESNLTTNGLDIGFTRTTQVVINADSSRTVTVTVVSENSAAYTTVDFETTFALWE